MSANAGRNGGGGGGGSGGSKQIRRTMSFNKVFGVPDERGGGGGGGGGRKKLHRLNYNNRNSSSNNVSDAASAAAAAAAASGTQQPVSPSTPTSNMYPTLPAYSPPSPSISIGNGVGQQGPNSPSASSSSPPQSALEKYSAVLLAEIRKKPGKEKALRDALDLQDKIHHLESELLLAESESVRRRAELESLLEDLDRQKEEARRAMAASQAQLEAKREETRRAIDAVRREPAFRDQQGIQKISREIDQLNVHARQVRDASQEGIPPPPPYAEAATASPSQADIDVEDDAFLCPVCLAVPSEQIFSCGQCDNMICGGCVGQVSACPTCRKSFSGSNSPKRNRLAERLVASKRNKLSGN